MTVSKIIKYFFLLLIAAICLQYNSFAQNTSIDSSKTLEKFHSPGKATLLSTFVPGAGQIYNKKYWKVPVLYGGMVALGFAIDFNSKEYNKFRKAYILRIDGDTTTVDNFVSQYSDSDLKTLRDFYRRNRDFSIIGMGLVYVLQIVDAHVDAHLFYFDVGTDLSLNLTPIAYPINNTMRAGISLTLNITK